MYAPALVTTLLVALAPFAEACNSHITQHPLFWLASLRNSTGTVKSGTTLNAFAPGLRRIRFEDGAAPIPILPSEKDELEKTGIRFFDVTEVDLEEEAAKRAMTAAAVEIQAYPSGPTHRTQVNAIIATLSQSNLQSDLAELTSYKTRYYRSTTGASASTALLTKLKNIVTASGRTDVSVAAFTHSWTQSSIIAKFAGSNSAAPIIIVGAHIDSINQSNPSSGTAPGADDNGSGAVNLIEAFRKLVSGNVKFTSPVEFHWYSGEEGGLLGSAAISKSYSSAGKQVRAMMNLDMTAYMQPGSTPQVGFVDDRTDASLTAFTKTLVPVYMSGLPATNDHCGYACSDHASWNTLGYPAVYPFETITQYEDPYIHTASDTSTVSGFSFAHCHEYTKLVVAFVMELGL